MPQLPSKEDLYKYEQLMSSSEEGSVNYLKGLAGFHRFQSECQLTSAKAMVRNARYMLYSVIVLALSALGTFIVTLVNA